MSRHLLFVLLLATSVALADDKPKAKHTAAKAKSKTEAGPGQAKKTQAKTVAAQERTAEAQAATEGAQQMRAARTTASSQPPPLAGGQRNCNATAAAQHSAD